jgi:hypothetical protein
MLFANFANPSRFGTRLAGGCAGFFGAGFGLAGGFGFMCPENESARLAGCLAGEWQVI